MNDLEQVGWWWWFDGDQTKSGQFRYDRSGRGASVPVYRERVEPMSANEHPARRDAIEPVWRQTLDAGVYTAEVLRVPEDITGGTGKLVLRKGDEVITTERVSLKYGAQFGPDSEDVAEWQDIVIGWLESRGL